MMLNILQDPPSIATRCGRHVDPALEAFARTLMARDASDRYPSAAAALAALDQIARRCAVPEPIVDGPTLRVRAARVEMPALKHDQQPPPRRSRLGSLVRVVVAALGGLTEG